MKLGEFLGESILSFVTPSTHACLHRQLGHAAVKHLVPVSAVIGSMWVSGWMVVKVKLGFNIVAAVE